MPYKLTQKEFIQKAKTIHDNKYNYDSVIYVNSHKKVTIKCPIHGNFLQTPHSHLKGDGCVKCSNQVSLQETQWLDREKILNKNRNITIRIKSKIYYVDGYNPQSNTIYEFYGDYWHGNPKKYKSKAMNKSNKKTFGALYKKTIQREKEIKSGGYNLITIWESDFKK